MKILRRLFLLPALQTFPFELTKLGIIIGGLFGKSFKKSWEQVSRKEIFVKFNLLAVFFATADASIRWRETVEIQTNVEYTRGTAKQGADAF